MAKKVNKNFGNPKPGEAAQNFDHVFTPRSSGVNKAYNSRANPSAQKSQPPSPRSGGRKPPQHYGERAHTRITQTGWPGAAAKRSNSATGGRGPHH